MLSYTLIIRLMIIGLVASSCTFKDLELKGVEGVELGKVNNGKIDGIMKVRIYNPNSFPITITKAKFDVFSSDVRIGDANLSRKFKIKANSEETYDVEIDANVKNLLTGGLGGLVNMLAGNKPKVTLDGNLKARSFLISKTIPVKFETTLPLN